MIKVFREICEIPCEEDCIKFSSDTITVKPITITQKYPGLCLTAKASLGKMVKQISIDVGFGDIVMPHPVSLNYPTLLSGIPAPVIFAYSMETVIAEKFQAMVRLGYQNSRMKDFYDVFYILKERSVNRHGERTASSAGHSPRIH